jgi:hypothetical protein
MALDQSKRPGVDLSIRLHHRRHTEVTGALLSALGAERRRPPHHTLSGADTLREEAR